MMIYRVEHRTEGFGPYIPRWDKLTDGELDLRQRAVMDHQDDDHPEPWEDGLGLTISPAEFCCFVSLDLLEAAGFGVAVYEVAEEYVRRGYRQSVFARSEATLLEFLEPHRAG